MKEVLLIGAIFFGIPIIVYFSVKFGTYAYYSARHLFEQQHKNKR